MVRMEQLEGAEGIHVVDTEGFRARQYCAVYVLEGDPAVLVEAGASPTVDVVLDALDELGIQRSDVGYVAPTHLHLDHAGATGHLLEALPEAVAVLHADYADYLIEPEGLVRSVQRAVGEERFPLYGTCKPLDPERVLRVKGGETLVAGDRRLEVTYAPGHAPHHVVYLDEGSGTLFTGDAAGIWLPANEAVEETTPPPAYDREAYLDTLRRLEDLEPDRLALTHFGVREDVAGHLHAYADVLEDWTQEIADAWKQHQDEEAVVQEVMGNHPEWRPGYTDEDFEGVRRMDIRGALLYLDRQDAIRYRDR